MNRPLTLRYLSLDDAALRADLLCCALNPNQEPRRETHHRALDRLGASARADGEAPLNRWLRWLCEVNGLPATRPVPRALADAGAARFCFVLA